MRLSLGSFASASPDRNSPFGISRAPGIARISNSAGSRTSMTSMASCRSIIPASSRAVIVEPRRGLDGRVAHRPAELLVVDQLGDRLGLGIAADLDRAVLHVQRVVDHQAAEQRVADAGDELDRLGRHHAADRGAKDAEHAALGAARHHPGRRRHRVQVAVGQAPIVRRGLPEDADLALEAVDRPPHVGLAEQHAGVVHEVAGREVVGPVDHQVIARQDLERVLALQPQVVQLAR